MSARLSPDDPSPRTSVDVVVIGAGPCGIGAARELRRLGVGSVLVLEASDRAGGLAASTVDAAGFTWDRGGHVVFSHHGEFDRLLAEVVGEEVWHHDRSSWVRVADSWVPYPFQNNLHHLPGPLAEVCLVGLVEAATAQSNGPAPKDFAGWARSQFGEGVFQHFMDPYNRKVWATDPADLSASWIAERVSVVDWKAVLGRALRGIDDLAWGPNNRFAFPKEGGTGRIWDRAADAHADQIRYRCPVASVDAFARVLSTADGAEIGYTNLVSTMPVDHLVRSLTDAPGALRTAAEELVHNTVHVVGVGYEAPLTDDRSWLYFADPDVPFYRATNFAKYAAANVPDGDTDRYCSWMCEVATPASIAPADPDLGDRVEAALRRTGVVAGNPEVASLHVETVPYAYPLPTLGRDADLANILPWLDAHGIYSRGRFGTWRYETGNMDHAVKMGVDVARRIVSGSREELVPEALVATTARR